METGRMEHKRQNVATAERLLSDMPSIVADYYYHISVSSEATTSLEYVRKIRKFLSWTNPNMSEITSDDIKAIRESDVSRYLASTQSYENANGETVQTKFSTQKLNIAALRSFFEYLVQAGVKNSNIMEHIKAPRNHDRIERKKITEQNVADMVNATHTGVGNQCARSKQKTWAERDTAIMMLFVNTGMRKTALTEINVDDIKGNYLTVTDKRHKEHVYKLNSATKDALDAWLVRRKELLGEEKSPALFISNRRTRMCTKSVDELVKKYSAEALGGNGVSPHKLRGAYIGILYDKTGDVEFVRSAVGHSNVATTQRYIADDGSSKERAAEIMESIFSA